MSRLESFIRRMVAQRDSLDMVAAMIGDIPGPVLELGLGNGRTYDHLRERLPEREIFVFDRAIRAHPTCVPPARYLIIGEIRDTLAFCGPRVGEPAALIHCDLGTGDATTDLATKSWVSPLIDERLAAGGIVMSGLELALAAYEAIPLPAGVKPGRYFIYRKPAA